jgi:hypothetical protein
MLWDSVPNKTLQPTQIGDAGDRENPVTVIRRVLATCHDEAPSASSSELMFITDPDFRHALRVDLGAIETALRNGEWKAATVLAGSLVEALLFWKLDQKPAEVAAAQNKAKRKAPLEEWVLGEYIAVAAELNVITATTAIQAKLAKDFRNLIHPGRAIRLGQVCNRGTALSAFAAVEHVIGDLR